MKNGLGTLFVLALGIIMFANPSSLPPSPKSSSGSAKGANSHVSKNIGALSASPSNVEICKNQEDLTCATCTGVCPSEDVLNAIQAFFGREEKATASTARQPHLDAKQEVSDLRRHWGVPPAFRKQTEFVIATVPDPIHTHLSLFFDRQIDAIAEAAQEYDYLFARASMPWVLKPPPESSDFKNRRLQEDYTASKEQIPGLMIFHKTEPDSDQEPEEFLFVFVVGESPTGGIQKQQFRTALRAIRDIREGTTPPQTLRILGPTFSGSLYSLMDELKANTATSYSKVLLRSGTTSSWQTIQWFQNYCCRPDNVEFMTFMESDCYMFARLAKFADLRHVQTAQIAVLSEDETAYGNQDPKKPPSSPAPVQCSGAIGPRTVDRKATAKSPCDYSAAFVHLYFPRDISQLRSAYQRDVQNDESSDSSGVPAPRNTLRLNFEDSGSNDDTVRSYSQVQTPLSQEGVLSAIVASLLKHHVEFVVVRATNPLDTLFLCRYLRSAYPEGRLVTVGADLLFQREVYDPRLQGILAITSYSLLPNIGDEIAVSSQLPAQFHSDRVFPASTSVGTYNAMLSLLSATDTSSATPAPKQPSPTCTSASPRDASGKYPSDLPDSPYAEYGWPSKAGNWPSDANGLAPPLWLTVVGRNGYWPFAVLDAKPFADCHSALPSNIHAVKASADISRLTSTFRPHVPLPWKVLCSICFIVVMAYILLLWFGSSSSSSEALASFAPVTHPVRSWLICAAGLMLVGALTSLFAPTVSWAAYAGFKTLGLAIACLLTILVVVSLIDLVVREASRAAVVFAVLTLIIFSSSFLWMLSPESTVNLDLYRYVHLTAGLSPLMPFLLLLVAGLWWIWYTLASLALQDTRRPFLPKRSDLGIVADKNGDFPPHLRRLLPLSHEANVDLMKSMAPFPLLPRVYVGPAIVVAGFLAINRDNFPPVQGLEGISFTGFYTVALVAVVFVLLVTLSRLTFTWMEFRSLLRVLDRLPLRRGFVHLKGLAWKPIWRLSGGDGDFRRILSRQIESLPYLKKILGDSNELKGPIDETEQAIKDLDNYILNFPPDEGAANQGRTTLTRLWFSSLWLKLGKSGLGPEFAKINNTLGKVEEIQKKLARTSGATLQYLNDRWPQDKQVALFPTPPSPEKDHDSQQPEQTEETKQAEQFVCLTFLSFILTVIFRIKKLIVTIAGLFVFLLLSFSAYPFEPRVAFHTIMALLFVISLGVVAFVFAQMHRDPTLSYITDTTPGELGLDFWLRLASFAFIPLLSLLSAQFPEINRLLFSLMQPILQAFKQ
jgi:hypothetical protein